MDETIVPRYTHLTPFPLLPVPITPSETEQNQYLLVEAHEVPQKVS